MIRISLPIPLYSLKPIPIMKRKLTLSLNEEVITRVKKAGINLNSFLEIRLMDYLSGRDSSSEG